MKFLMTKDSYERYKYTIRCGILRCWWWVEARSLCSVISMHLFESYYHNPSSMDVVLNTGKNIENIAENIKDKFSLIPRHTIQKLYLMH